MMTSDRDQIIERGEQTGLSYECFGEYTDEWTRTSEGWRINSRVLRVSFDLGDRRTLQPG